MVQQELPSEEASLDNSFAMESLSLPAPTLDTLDEISLSQSKSVDHFENMTVDTVQQTDLMTSAGKITITSPIMSVAMSITEDNVNAIELQNQSVLSLEQETVQLNESIAMDVSPELTATPTTGQHMTIDKLISPTTPSVPKERKKRIIIDDDDESPTFNPLRSTKKSRSKNRRKNLLLKRQQRKAQLLSPTSSALIDKANENAIFTSPEGIVSIILNS